MLIMANFITIKTFPKYFLHYKLNIVPSYES